MATHSSILAWRVPGIEAPGGLQSTGSRRVDTTEHTHVKPCTLFAPPPPAVLSGAVLGLGAESMD